MKTNPDDPQFLTALKGLKKGSQLEVDDGILTVEDVFDVPTHFNWHQRIFEPGMILHLEGSNVRVYIEAEKLGLPVKHRDMTKFDNRQIVNGKILAADHTGFKSNTPQKPIK